MLYKIIITLMNKYAAKQANATGLGIQIRPTVELAAQPRSSWHEISYIVTFPHFNGNIDKNIFSLALSLRTYTLQHASQPPPSKLGAARPHRPGRLCHHHPWPDSLR
jgi:hypothetical protein